MKVRLICQTEIGGWILGKMASKLKDELIKAGAEVDIGETPDANADINHYMLYLNYDEECMSSCDTLMVTHVDRKEKLLQIKKQLDYARLGICMSEETMNILSDYGIEANKLCYVNPAHDGVIKPQKVVIGLASKVYEDGRKREQFLTSLCNKISPEVFSFKIMGEGWEPIITSLKDKSFEVEYYDVFDYERYTKLIPELDYYLYMGQDEGSMGFVDALSAGVKTIVTSQGYHLDAPNGITYAFDSLQELTSIFLKIEADKNTLINSVKTWTWEHYALKHLELWKFIRYGEVSKSIYPDGLNTLLNKPSIGSNKRKQFSARYRIFRLTVSRFMNSNDKIGKIKRKLGLQ